MLSYTNQVVEQCKQNLLFKTEKYSTLISLKCQIGIAHGGQLFAAKYLKSGAAMLINDGEYFSHIVSAARCR